MCSFVGLEQVDASRQVLDDRIERLDLGADYPLIHPYHMAGYRAANAWRVGSRTPLFRAMLEYARKLGVLQQGDAVPQCAYLVVPAPSTLQHSAGAPYVECRPQHLFKSLYQGYKDRVKHIGGTVWAMAPTTISYSIIEGSQVSPVKVIASGSDRGDVSWHTSRDGSNEDRISPDSLRLQDQYGNFIRYDDKSRCIMSYIVNGHVTGRVTMNNRPVGQPEALKGIENVLSMFVWLNSFDYSKLQATGIFENKAHSWDREGALLCSVLMEKFPAVSGMIMRDPRIVRFFEECPLPKRPLKRVPGGYTFWGGDQLKYHEVGYSCIPETVLLAERDTSKNKWTLEATLFGRIKDDSLAGSLQTKLRRLEEWSTLDTLDVVVLTTSSDQAKELFLINTVQGNPLCEAKLLIDERVESVTNGQSVRLFSNKSKVIPYISSYASREKRGGLIVVLNQKDSRLLKAALLKNPIIGDVFRACTSEGMESLITDLSAGGILYPFLKR